MGYDKYSNLPKIATYRHKIIDGRYSIDIVVLFLNGLPFWQKLTQKYLLIIQLSRYRFRICVKSLSDFVCISLFPYKCLIHRKVYLRRRQTRRRRSQPGRMITHSTASWCQENIFNMQSYYSYYLGILTLSFNKIKILSDLLVLRPTYWHDSIFLLFLYNLF